jgi:peptidoglycan/LPS O-acetylase OafA/YrhL
MQSNRAAQSGSFQLERQLQIPALDGVRGFAAAAVFAYHYGGGDTRAFFPCGGWARV